MYDMFLESKIVAQNRLGIFPRPQLLKHQIQWMKLKTETNMLKIHEDRSE